MADLSNHLSTAAKASASASASKSKRFEKQNEASCDYLPKRRRGIDRRSSSKENGQTVRFSPAAAASSAWKKRECLCADLPAPRMSKEDILMLCKEVDKGLYGAEFVEQADYKLWGEIDHDYELDVESEGFDVIDFPPDCVMSTFFPVYDFGVGSLPYVLANIALGQFNSIHLDRYELIRVISVNGRLACGYIYYITFQAVRAHYHYPNGPLVTFQARVWDCVPTGVIQVELCRIKPFP